VKGTALDTPIGRAWYTDVVPLVKTNIAKKCTNWTQQGYPISIDDFEIDIEGPGTGTSARPSPAVPGRSSGVYAGVGGGHWVSKKIDGGKYIQLEDGH